MGINGDLTPESFESELNKDFCSVIQQKIGLYFTDSETLVVMELMIYAYQKAVREFREKATYLEKDNIVKLKGGDLNNGNWSASTTAREI